jgi:orotate phosphoribosyltransferase
MSMDQTKSILEKNDGELKAYLVQKIRNWSYREGDFTLASGQKSKFYIDLKATTLHPEGATLVGELAARVLRKTGWKIGGVGGLTLGADPIATAVSVAAFRQGEFWPAFIVRKESKGHGTEKYVEGTENLKSGDSLVILEDVVTTGGSSVQAIQRVRAEGYQVAGVLTIVDREQGGRAAFHALGVELISLATISEIAGR